MSMYGYSEALSQGSAFNSRINTFNEGVKIHNQKLQDEYDTKIKQRPGKVADDQRQRDMDEAFYGFKDGTSGLNTLVGTGRLVSGVSKHGFKQYAVDEVKGRANSIKSTAKALVHGEEAKPLSSAMELGEIGDDGKVIAGTAGRTVEEAAEGARTAATLAGDGAKVAEATAKRESSNLVAQGVKKAIGGIAGKAIGDAGLTALSEVGGKVIGDFSGVLDIGHSIKNLAEGKNFFSGESTADKFQEAGAALDLVGIAFPPAEVIGGILNLTGGIMDAVDDINADMDKKKQDAADPEPPKKTSFKVTPAFQSMGLVASQLPSAKSQIVGGGF